MAQECALPSRIQALINPRFLNSGVTRENILDLPANAIKGIGPVYKERLRRLGIIKIKDFSELPRYATSNDLHISMKLLEKFWLSSQLIVHYTRYDEEKESGRKIVLAGLDKAGKTSIIQSIQTMEPVVSTKATMGVHIDQFEIVGKKIVFWDLGGQATFRHMFARPGSVHFSGLSLLIFVFDVQARSRALEGLQYFERVLMISNFLHQKPKVAIFFHKYDKSGQKGLIPLIESNKEQLLTRINPLVKRYEMPSIVFFDTSVYNISSLVQAFSKTLITISPVASVLNGILEFYGKNHNVLGIFLMSDKGLIIAEYVGKLDEKRRDEALIRALTGVRDNPDIPVFSEEVRPGLFVTVEQMVMLDVKLFLTTVSEHIPEVKSNDPQLLHDMLEPWLANLFASLQ